MLNKITFVSAFLLLVFTALYYDTRTEVHTFDALSYTNDVETKPFGQLYHPHHLLYGPLGRLTFDLAKNLGYEGRADQPIQFINALAGAFGIVMLWQFGRQFTGKNWQPLGIAVLVGMCYAYWLYATEVEVYTLAALFIVLALWGLTRLDQQPSVPKVVFLALAAAGAVMFHQTNVLFTLPLGLFLLLDSRLRKYLPVFGGVFVAAVALPYLAVGWNSGFRDFDAFYDWLTGYAQTGQWGGNLNLSSIDALRAGLQNTVSPHNGTLAALFYLLAGVGLLIGLRSLKKTWLVFSISWLILYGGFFWWWEPWNIEFWIVLLPLWALWMYFPYRGRESFAEANLSPPLPQRGKTDFFPSLLVGLGADRKMNVGAGTRAVRPIPALFRAGIAPFGRLFLPLLSAPQPLVGEGSGVRGIFPLSALLLALFLFRAHHTPIREAADARNDYYQQITETLAPHLRQTDLVVTRGNILDLYLPFYANHPPSFVISLREMGGSKLDTLIQHITPAYHYGQLIFIDQMVLDEPVDGQRNPFGLTVDEIAAFKTRFPIQENVRYAGRNVFYSISKRTPPETRLWSFQNNLQGWTAFGLNHARFENGGWCFTGGGDPWLESPEVQVDTANTTRIQIDMEIQSAAKEGQVFWRRQDEGLSEDRSLRFPLTVGRQTYTLELTGEKGWEGTIVFLRLDPIPENLEVTACVYEIQLLP